MSESQPTTTSPTPPPDLVREVLDRLRGRIRWYVVTEGLAALVVFLGVAFWIGLGLDYLPVLMGANEMPRQARMVLLMLVGVAALVVLQRYILRRIRTPMRDTSLALLIERQFPGFRDSLVTTVELTGQDANDALRRQSTLLEEAEPSAMSADMLARTVQQATNRVEDIQLSKVFRFTPLLSKLTAALVVVGSIVALGIVSRDALGTATSRLLGLSEMPWPRRAYIELVDFTDGARKVAKGTDLVIRVRADATRPAPPPELCTILYQTHDGDRGRANMSRDGEPRDGYQYYVFNGKPFKGILNDITFDVIGYDYRIREQRVKVVLSPVVTQVRLQSELPAYTQLLPRDELWSPGLQLPIGSRIRARITTNKSIVSATRRDIDTGDELVTHLDQPAREIIHEIDNLVGRHAIAIHLTDTDGIESLEPFLLTIGAIEDQVPDVDVSLRGIGSSITSQARLAVEGHIRDDYDVARRWFELKLEDGAREFELDPANVGEAVNTALDLRAEGGQDRESPLQLNPQDRITFSVKAQDRFDLDGASHVGSSDQVALTVVRPDELLAILDGRELGLRRRFEQIRAETIQSRDSLARLRASFNATQPESEDSETLTETTQRNLEDLRERWASWANQKTSQTVLEVAGVALAFEDIREELMNNRVDTPERKLRLEEQIIAPLREIAELLLPALREQEQALLSALRERAASAESEAVEALIRADRVVVAMDAVLEKMLELEDYAELVNVIRQILEDQQQLLEKTKEERDRGVLDFLK